MKLIILTAVLAVCGAAKLEKRFILPGSSHIGGSAHVGGSAHLGGSAHIGGLGAFSRGLTSNVPSGGYTNDAQGVVVDAVSPGIRTSGVEPTGLGGPRTAYGSVNSKVGDAAFKVGEAAIKTPFFGLGAAGDSNSPVSSGFGSATGNAGSLGLSVSPGAASISADSSGFGSAALKGGNAGGLGISVSAEAGSVSTGGSGLGSAEGSFGVTPGAGSLSTDGLGFGSTALKGGNTGGLGINVSPGADSVSPDYSGFGSAALKGGNAGGLSIGVSPEAGSGAAGGFGLGSASGKGGNAGSFGIGGNPGAGPLLTDGLGFGSTAHKGGSSGTFGIGVSPGVASISPDSSGFGSAALKGGNTGGLGINVSPGAGSVSAVSSGLGSTAGSFGFGVTPGTGSLSTDGLGFGSTALKGGSSGTFGIGVSSGVGSISPDTSGFGSAALKGGNAGGFGIGVAPGAASISTKGNGLGSATVKGGNAGSFGFGVKPGADLVSTDGSGLSSTPVKEGNAGGFGIGLSPGTGSISTGNFGFGSDAVRKNEGSFGIGVTQGVATISTDGSGFGSKTDKGGKVGGFGTGVSSQIDSKQIVHEEDKAYAQKFATSFGLKKYSYGFETDNGISVGAKGVSTDGIKANGEYSYKGNDGKDYSVKYTADKNGYRPEGSHLPTPPPIPVEIVESLKQNAKEEAAGVFDDGTYNAQKYKDEGQAASSGGWFKNQATKSSVVTQSSGSLKGSVGVQGSHGHAQGFEGQTFGNKNFGFNLKHQTTSQHEQENLNHGLFSVKPQLDFQTSISHAFKNTGSFGVQADNSLKPIGSGSIATAIASTGNDQNGQFSGSPTGVPTLGGSLRGSSNDNPAYSSATATGSGSASAFATTGNIDATVQGTQGSKSYNVASQPYLKLVDNRPKLHKQPSKDVSLSTSSAKVSTLGGSLNNFPAQISTNTNSNSANDGFSSSSLSGQYQGSTSSHNNDITQASISSFPSLLPSLSSNFGQTQKPIKYSQSTYGQKLSVSGGTKTNGQPGAVYEYSKPTTSLSSEGHVVSSQLHSETETSQTLFGSQGSLNIPSQTQYSQKPIGSSQSGSKLQQTGVSSFQKVTQQNPGSIYEYNKPAVSLTFSKDGVSHATGSSLSQTQLRAVSGSQGVQKAQTTGTLSQKPVGTFQTDSGYKKTQVGVSSDLLFNKQKFDQGNTFSYNGAFKDKSEQTTQLNIKPFSSSLTTGPSFSHTQYGGTTESLFGQKPHTTGSLSQTSTTFGQKPVGDSQTSTKYEKTQFSSSYGSIPSQKTSSSGPSKVESAQTIQFGVKPFGSVQTTGTSFSQIQLDSTSQSAQKPQISAFGQKPVDFTQTSSTQFGSSSGALFNKKSQSSQSSSFASGDASKGNSAHATQFGISPFGSSQTVESSFAQTHLGTTFDQKPQTTGTLSQTTTTFEQKPVSHISTTLQKTQFGSSTGLLFKEKSQSGQGSSYISSDASKGQSGLSTHFGVKPFGSTSITGSSSPQTHFDSTSGFKFGEKSQTTGTLSQSTIFRQKPAGATQTSTTFEKTQFGPLSSSDASKGQYGSTTQLGLKPFGSTLNEGSSFSQSKFSSTSGSQNDQKSQLGVGTISTTFPHVTPISQYGKKPFGAQSTFGAFQQSQHFESSTGSKLQQQPQLTGQKPTGISHTEFDYKTSQFGSLSSPSLSVKPQSTLSSSFATSGASKGDSAQTGQLGVKPFGSSQSQLGTSGSSLSQKSSGTLSQKSTTFGLKPVDISHTGTTYDKTQFGSLSGTLFNEKSQTSQGGSFSSNAGVKGQSGLTTQFGVKPFGSTSSTGSSFSQTQFSGTSESQKDHKSQSDVGTISTFPHVTPISQYGTAQTGQFGEKPFGSSQSQLGTSGSFFNQKEQSSNAGVKGQSGVTTQFGVKPFGSTSSTGSSFSQTQFSGTSESQKDHKSQLGVGTISTTFPHVTPISQYGTAQTGKFEVKPFGSSQSQLGTFGSSFNQKEQSSNAGVKGQSGVTTQFGVKPFGSTSSTGSSFSQTQFSGTSESQKDHKSQSGVGTISTTFPHVTSISQNGKNPFGTQSTTFGSFQQTQHYANQKPQATGTFSPTSTTFVEKPVGVSLTSTTSDKPSQFGSSSSSLLNEKLQSTQGSSFSSSGPSKSPSGLTTQFGVKPFVSKLNTGSSFSQTQFSGTSESQKDHKSQSGVGTISTTFPHVTSISQNGKNPFGTQSTTFGSFQQTQHYANQKPQATGTFSPTSTTFVEKPVGVSLTSTTSDKPSQFGSSSSSLLNEKLQSTQGSSFSSSGPSKSPSGLTTQFGVKPFVSKLNTGSSFSQTQFSGTSESQKDHKSQSGVGTISTTFPHVTSISQNGKNPFGTQSTTFGSFQQTQHYANQKPQATGTFLPTSTTFVEKPVGVSLTSTTSDKPSQFGSSSSSLLNEKLQSTQGSSFSSSGPSKSPSGLTTQFGVKPFVSKLNTGSSFSQTQFSGTSESQKDHKSQSGVGTISTTFPHVTSISQNGKNPFGTQSTTFGSFQQTQHYANQKPQATGTFSPTSTTFVEKPVGVSLTSTTSDKPSQFGSSSSSLLNEKLQSTQGSSFSSSGPSKSPSGLTSQFGVKPFGSKLNTGSSFSQTQFSSTSENQNDQKTQSGVGTISNTFPQVTPISQYVNKPFNTQSAFGSFQHSQYTGQKPQTTGIISQTSTTFNQKSGTTSDKTQFGSSSSSLLNEKLQSTQGSSFSSSGPSKSPSGLTTQFGVKPFVSKLNTGSSFSQTQFSGTSESQKNHKSQSGVGTISTTFPHVPSISQNGKNPFGTQSTTFGSFQQTQHYANQKPQATGTFSPTSTTFVEKPVGVSLTSTTSDKPSQFGSSSSSLLNEKLQSTQSSSFSSSGPSKSPSGLTSQFGVKPFGSKLNTVSSFSQTHLDSTSGSLFGQKPQATGFLSLSSTTDGQKPVSVSQTSSEKTQFESLSGSLFNEKSQASQGGLFSSNDATKWQSGSTTQFGVKPTLSTGSSFSQAQFGITSGFQNDKKSQLGLGTISTGTPQVIPISQYNKKPFGFQSTQNYFQQSQFSGSTGSKIGQNGQSDGSYTQYTIVGQTPTGVSQSDSGLQTQLDSLLQSTQSGSLFLSDTSKVQSELTNKFGSGPFSSSPSTGSSSTQSQFDSTFNSQSNKKPIIPLSSQDLLQGSFGGIQNSQATKYQTSQLSTSGVQPIGSLLSQTIEQQKTQTASKIGEQKPIGGFESSFEQTQVTGIQKPFDHKEQHLPNSNQFTASSSSNRYPSSEIHIYREQNVQGVSGQGVSEPGKVVTGTKTTFSKVEKKVNFQGPGELFLGFKEPPKFDIKTGYHY